MTGIWRVLPYCKGKTRAISIFIKLLAYKNNLGFNTELLSQNAGYFRNALVIGAVDEVAESSYLHCIITYSSFYKPSNLIKQSDTKSSAYNAIVQYDVTNHEEKLSYTKYD